MDDELIRSIWNQFDEIRNNASDSDPPDHEKKGNIIKIWLDKLKAAARPYVDGHICSNICTEQGAIEEIDRTTRIYGCKIGRIPHICYGDPANCRLMDYSMDGEAVCIFSGAVLFPDTVIDLYGKGEKGITMDLTGEASLEEIQIGALLNKEHGPGGTEYCLNWSNKIFRSHEQFQEFKDAEKTGPRRYLMKNRIQLNLSEINGIVKDLLFNKTERIRINLKYEGSREKQAQDAYRKYLKTVKRKKEAPNKMTIIAIIEEYLRQITQLKILDYDSKKVDFVQNFIMNLWFAIKKTPYFINNVSSFHIKQHTIGMLYMLTEPLVFSISPVEYDVLLEADTFLMEHLPPQSELKDWNSGNTKTKHKYTKRDITAGINNFKNAINSATINKDDVLRLIKTAPRRKVLRF